MFLVIAIFSFGVIYHYTNNPREDVEDFKCSDGFISFTVKRVNAIN